MIMIIFGFCFAKGGGRGEEEEEEERGERRRIISTRAF